MEFVKRRILTCLAVLRQSASSCLSAGWALQRQAQIRLPLPEEDPDSPLPPFHPNSTVMDTSELEDDADARGPWCDVVGNKGLPSNPINFAGLRQFLLFPRLLNFSCMA